MNLIEAFLADRVAAGAGVKTVREYWAAWDAFAGWHLETTGEALNPATVSALDLAELRRHLERWLRPSSVNTRLRQLKAVFSWAVAQGFIDQDPARALRQVPEQEPPIKTLDRRTVAALLREAQKAGTARDVALITVLAQTGLRVSEALALTWADTSIRERSGSVTVRRGKGGKTRIVPLTLTARQALAAWRGAMEPDAGSRVFPVGARAVQKALARYARRAGIEGRVTPHMFRHTFCKALVDAGCRCQRLVSWI